MNNKFVITIFLIGVLLAIFGLSVFLNFPKKRTVPVVQYQDSSTSDSENPFVETPTPTITNPFDEQATYSNPFGEESTEENQPYQNPFGQ